ncbi:hypothetical protein Tco_0644695 [Tanacetum coccineum]
MVACNGANDVCGGLREDQHVGSLLWAVAENKIVGLIGVSHKRTSQSCKTESTTESVKELASTPTGEQRTATPVASEFTESEQLDQKKLHGLFSIVFDAVAFFHEAEAETVCRVQLAEKSKSKSLLALDLGLISSRGLKSKQEFQSMVSTTDSFIQEHYGFSHLDPNSEKRKGSLVLMIYLLTKGTTCFERGLLCVFWIAGGDKDR